MAPLELWGNHIPPITSAKHLADLRQKHGVPPNVEMILRSDDPFSPETVPPGFCCAYTVYFEKCGLVFPIPRIIFQILQRLRMAFPQMCPNFVRHVMGVYVRGRELGFELGVDDILRLYLIKHNSGFPGTFYTCRRRSPEIIQALPGKDDRWREKYFYFRVTPAAVGDYNFARLPTQWAVCVGQNDPLVLSCYSEEPPRIPATRELIERLRAGEVRWNSFTRARIIAALNAPLVRDTAAPVPPLPANPARSERADNSPARRELSSSSTSTPLRTMVRKPSLRELREQSQQPRRVRAGDVDAALANALRAVQPAPSRVVSEEVNQAPVISTGPSGPAKEVMLVSSQSTHAEPSPTPKRARTDNPRIPETRSRESRGGYPAGGNPEAPAGEPIHSGNGSSSSRPFHWRFAHSRDSPAVEDHLGMATLFRHLKTANCQVPLVKDLVEREAYIEAMAAHAKSVAADNKLIVLYERRLKDTPQAAELENTTRVVHELTTALKAAQEREGAANGKVASLEDELTSLRSIQDKLLSVEADLASAQDAHAMAARDRDLLKTENKWLKEKAEGIEQKHAEATRQAVREAKERMSQDYRAVLDSVKSKWERKKEKTAVESDLAEIESNLLLIKQIDEGRTSIAEEVQVLETQRAVLAISEDSVAPMEVDAGTGVPRGLDEHGSNASVAKDPEAGTGEEDV
ncbi:PREDICTED: uncharacterized protein At3g60930, chloroplastic-like [Camelina sativa]|uniref:Uncharacterized protein At3g60930, chloroplastic-like n=1 Tax=Camelina sativa TaxID=90675 RepID=A0ABM1QFU3_CAMSA|nr:PREDICTED: uncharacterized protein At3g60930, chloroplastic-like [Camelina sativa]